MRRMRFAAVLLGVLLTAAASGQESGRLIPREELEQVLGSDEFGRTEERRVLRWRQNEEREIDNFDIPDVQGFGRLLAVTLRWVVIAAAATIVVVIIWRNRGAIRSIIRGRRRDRPDADTSGTVFTGTDDPRTLFAEGSVREAWAALYRALVNTTVARYELSVGPDATEGTFLAEIAHYDAELRATIDPIVRAWRMVAYAHSERPHTTAFTAGLSLLERLRSL